MRDLFIFGLALLFGFAVLLIVSDFGPDFIAIPISIASAIFFALGVLLLREQKEKDRGEFKFIPVGVPGFPTAFRRSKTNLEKKSDSGIVSPSASRSSWKSIISDEVDDEEEEVEIDEKKVRRVANEAFEKYIEERDEKKRKEETAIPLERANEIVKKTKKPPETKELLEAKRELFIAEVFYFLDNGDDEDIKRALYHVLDDFPFKESSDENWVVAGMMLPQYWKNGKPPTDAEITQELIKFYKEKTARLPAMKKEVILENIARKKRLAKARIEHPEWFEDENQ